MLFAVSSHPSERDDIERVLPAVDGVQEVAVGDLRTRKHLQLTADTNGDKVMDVIQPHRQLKGSNESFH